MFVLLREGGEDIKAEDIRTGQMYLKSDDEWRALQGSLDQHLKFHPYAEVIEVERVPGLNIESSD